jgi:hypothetical protein
MPTVGSIAGVEAVCGETMGPRTESCMAMLDVPIERSGGEQIALARGG